MSHVWCVAMLLLLLSSDVTETSFVSTCPLRWSRVITLRTLTSRQPRYPPRSNRAYQRSNGTLLANVSYNLHGTYRCVAPPTGGDVTSCSRCDGRSAAHGMSQTSVIGTRDCANATFTHQSVVTIKLRCFSLLISLFANKQLNSLQESAIRLNCKFYFH